MSPTLPHDLKNALFRKITLDFPIATCYNYPLKGAFVQPFVNSFVWMFRRFIDGVSRGRSGS